jgi:hypothetical protein
LPRAAAFLPARLARMPTTCRMALSMWRHVVIHPRRTNVRTYLSSIRSPAELSPSGWPAITRAVDRHGRPSSDRSTLTVTSSHTIELASILRPTADVVGSTHGTAPDRDLRSTVARAESTVRPPLLVPVSPSNNSNIPIYLYESTKKLEYLYEYHTRESTGRPDCL